MNLYIFCFIFDIFLYIADALSAAPLTAFVRYALYMRLQIDIGHSEAVEDAIFSLSEKLIAKRKDPAARAFSISLFRVSLY